MNREKLVLIVDDNSDNIKLLSNILFEAQYNVAIANSGAKAIKIANKKLPDLILLDIMMPEMNGFEVCYILKQNDLTKDIPIIFLTAKTETESIVEGFETGAVDYLTKPFRTEELLARVNTQLELRSKTFALNNLINTLEEKVDERTKSLTLANQKLSVLDESKTYFLSLVAHELNTPINIINGFISLLQSDDVSEEQQEYLHYISMSVERLKVFAQASLLITDLKSKNYRLTLNTNSLKSILIDTMDKLRITNQFDINRVKINIENHDTTIKIDEFLIKRCFDIIFSNFENHVASPGILEICYEQNCDYQVIVFQDNGPGFNKLILDNKFKLFISDNIMTHSHGHGLGLSSLKIIMEAHSGKVEIGNNENGGAFVKLYFRNDLE